MSLIFEPSWLIIKSFEPSRLSLKVVRPHGLINLSSSSSKVFRWSINEVDPFEASSDSNCVEKIQFSSSNEASIIIGVAALV